jgi:hypothetical protein
MNILSLEIWIGSQHFVFRHSVSEHSYYSGNGNPEAPNAGHSAHLRRIDCNASKFHALTTVTRMIVILVFDSKDKNEKCLALILAE